MLFEIFVFRHSKLLIRLVLKGKGIVFFGLLEVHLAGRSGVGDSLVEGAGSIPRSRAWEVTASPAGICQPLRA